MREGQIGDRGSVGGKERNVTARRARGCQPGLNDPRDGDNDDDTAKKSRTYASSSSAWSLRTQHGAVLGPILGTISLFVGIGILLHTYDSPPPDRATHRNYLQNANDDRQSNGPGSPTFQYPRVQALAASPEGYLQMDHAIALPGAVVRNVSEVYLSDKIEDLTERISTDLTKLSDKLREQRRTRVDRIKIAELTNLVETAHDALLISDRPTGLFNRTYDVIIGIISARDHFEQRQAIRDTWMKSIRTSHELRDIIYPMFIVGGEPCKIPQIYREDGNSFECREAPRTLPQLDHQIDALKLSHIVEFSDDADRFLRGSFGTDFEVKRWIQISRLGVFDSYGDGFRNNITLSVWDVLRSTVIVQVTIQATNGPSNEIPPPQYPNGKMVYVHISPIFLPEGFVGSIVGSGFSVSEPVPVLASGLSFDDGNGIIKLIRNSRYDVSSEQTTGLPSIDHVHTLSSDFPFGATMTFISHRERPSNVYQVTWQDQLQYTIVTMYTSDKLQIIVPHPLHQIYKHASEREYHSCDFKNISKVQPQVSDQRLIEFSKLTSGEHYFSDLTHCTDGLKLKVTVKDQTVEDAHFAHSQADRAVMESTYLESVKAESRLLQKEILLHDDIHLVPGLVDTYRNLPKKLLAFYEVSSAARPRIGTIKTDDDCFLNIQRILPKLRKLPSNGWWSQFRENWPVPRFGKWAEHDFKSSTYPPFACGSGNAVGTGLVQWLAKNSQELHRFQGEDISMGIWLSAIDPRLHKDSDWSCFGLDKGCNPKSLSIPELSPGQLVNLWQNWNHCMNPCGCTGGLG